FVGPVAPFAVGLTPDISILQSAPECVGATPCRHRDEARHSPPMASSTEAAGARASFLFRSLDSSVFDEVLAPATRPSGNIRSQPMKLRPSWWAAFNTMKLPA